MQNTKNNEYYNASMKKNTKKDNEVDIEILIYKIKDTGRQTNGHSHRETDTFGDILSASFRTLACIIYASLPVCICVYV